MVASVLLVMDANDWTIKDKPYDLRERLFNFACTVTRVSQFLHARGDRRRTFYAAPEERHVRRRELRGSR